MQSPIVDIRELTKTYITKRKELLVALNKVSLKIHRGEIFGLVGESGSGKSTLGRLLLRLEEADKGLILFDGIDIGSLGNKALKGLRKEMQIIFQDPYQSLNPYHSVKEILLEPLEVHRLGSIKERLSIIEETMAMVGLMPPSMFINAYPHQLSGGQRQRVAIARAMVLHPKFLVADEPTSMLDASISAQIFDILLKFKDEFDLTILFITHNLAAAYYLCDRIGVLYRGHLVELGPSLELLTQPYHPYTMALLDAIPKFGECEIIPRFNTLQRAEAEGYENIGCVFFKRCRPAHRIRCSHEVPQLTEIKENHFVACFLAEELQQRIAATGTCSLGI